MPNRVKIVIDNQTDFAFAQTGEQNDFVMNLGNLDPGSSLPPPRIASKASCDFTVQSPIGGPGPDGWFCYEFETLKMRVSINWTDATQTKAGKAQDVDVPDPDNPDAPPTQQKAAAGAVDPFNCTWQLLDGGIGELDLQPVALTDDRGNKVSVDQLAAWHQRDVAEQAKKDEHGNYIGVPKLLTAKFTLKVKNAQSAAAAPAVQPAVMPAGVVRPTGGSKAVVGKAFHTWNGEGLSPRRKKLLAVLGNKWPQIYVPPDGKLSGGDPFKKVPYQQLMGWTPGNGTSCTTLNGLVESILTGGKGGKWAFAAFHLEDAWVPWGGNPSKTMPNVGDIYILYRDIVADNPKTATDTPHERHCGFIVHVPEQPGSDWVTADGGQKGNLGGDAAYLNRRPWELRAPSQPDAIKQAAWDKAMVAHTFARPIKDTKYPYLGGGAESGSNLSDANRLIGWVDIDHPSITFKGPETFDTARDDGKAKFRQNGKYTEYDYQFLGAWIDDLLGTRADALAGWLTHLKDPTKPPPWQPTPQAAAPPP